MAGVQPEIVKHAQVAQKRSLSGHCSSAVRMLELTQSADEIPGNILVFWTIYSCAAADAHGRLHACNTCCV